MRVVWQVRVSQVWERVLVFRRHLEVTAAISQTVFVTRLSAGSGLA